jgi:hypothetical protein
MFAEEKHPGSLDLRRLERCQRHCLEAGAPPGWRAPRGAAGVGGSRAPPCFGRTGGGTDTRLPGVLLTEATLHRAHLPEFLLQHRAEYESLFRYVH